MSISYNIIKRDDGRFAIEELSTGKMLDDAQGYGYKTMASAEKAAWYKFKGGKEKMDAAKHRAVEFWKKNRMFAKEIEGILENCYKEISRGEVDLDQETVKMAKEAGIVGFDPGFIKYL